MESQQQNLQQSTIEPQPKPFAPYEFNKLSLISSLVKPKPQSVLSQIQAKKQKYYTQKLKQSSINREKFMSRFIQMAESKKAHHNHQGAEKECEKEEQSEERSSRRVSLTFSGDMESMTNRIDLLTMDKRQLSAIEMAESVDVSHQQSTKIQEKEHKKKKVKIIKKNNNNNSMNMTQTIQQSHQPQKMQQKSESHHYSSYSSNNNTSEFMFLTQYQRDQKQIMDRLLNIIEKEMQFNNSNSNNNNSRDLQRSETIIMDKLLMSRQQAIRQLQQNRRSRSRRVYKQNHNNNNESTQANNNNNSKPDNLKPENRRDNPALIQCEVNENDEEKINFQLLYQRLKEQQQSIAKNNIQQQKSQSETISNIPYSPRQFSSINPSHQTSANLTLLNYCNEQSETKNEKKSQKLEEQSSIRQIKKQDRRREACEKRWQKKKLSYQPSLAQQVNSSIVDSKSSQMQQKQQPQVSSNEKKQSVLMEIPFDDDNFIEQNNNKKQNISLAEAFKKKFGATRGQGKSQSKRIIKDNKKDENEKTAEVLKTELKQQQNQNQGKSILVKFKNIDINNNKQNTNTFQQTPRTHLNNPPSKSNTKSITSNNKNNNSNSNNKIATIKEPPKQLLDRLIYGKKVNMTKKDMYELSKKNYMKLPEVEERRRLQEKRQKQIQRLEKIKEYQKRIRASKVNCAASTYNNSQHPSSSTSIMQ